MTGAVMQCLPLTGSDAGRIASRLGIPLHEIGVHTFPDGELRVTTGPAAPTAILYAPLDRPNEKIIALLFAAEALRRNGAGRLVLLAPYLCYMRQDTAFHREEAISQRVLGKLIAQNFERLLTVDPHLHRIRTLAEAFPGIEAESFSAMPAIADFLRREAFDPQAVVVGPDAESLPWVRDLASRLGVDFAVAHKTRRGDRSVEVSLPAEARIRGRPVLLVDDIVSSGGTLAACARALAAAGCTTIEAVVTHALFPPEIIDEFHRAGIRRVRSTHSVPHPTNAITLDDIFVAALANEVADTLLRPQAP